jgi:hypothetical protein
MQLIKSAALVSVIILGAVAGCSSTTTVVTTNDGGGTDGGGTDAKKDVVTPPSDGSTASCKPQDVSSFKPDALVPPATQAGACSVQDTSDFFDNCIDPGDTTKCTAMTKDTTKAACLKCLTTPETAAKWGALIEDANNLIRNNIAGCLQVKGDAACAKAVEEDTQCSHAACPDTVCPVPSGDKAALAALNKCLTDAGKTVCKTYHDAASCLNGDAAAVTACIGAGSTFKDTYTAVAGAICVTGN